MAQWTQAVMARQDNARDPEYIKERFMKKVRVAENGCWIWLGASSLYGVFWYQGRQQLAHRVAVHLFKGEEPGECVLHACDTPLCVNPDHLRSGTYRENSQDMVDRNRSPRGSRSGVALLTEDVVAAIRAEYTKRDGEITRLAHKYGRSMSAISAIVEGRRWRHVETPLGCEPTGEVPAVKRPKGEGHHRAKLTSEQVLEMRRLFDVGDITLDGICSKYGIKKPQASAIVRRVAWRHL